MRLSQAVPHSRELDLALAAGRIRPCRFSNERENDPEEAEMEDGSDTEVEEGWYEDMEEELSDSEVEEEDEMEENGPPLPLTLSDSDVLDCPICTEPLSIPVYQCENGHATCSSCCVKVRNKCPSCTSHIGHIRCRLVEKVLESVTAPCKNKKYGCEETLKYCNKQEHEKMCPLSRCYCPVKDCNFKGTMDGLYSHFSSSHIFVMPVFSYNKYSPIKLERNQKHLIFCGEDNSIFVLNNFRDPNGSVIKVVRLAPSCCDKLGYEIKARYDETTITLGSPLENVLKWEYRVPERNILLVPCGCITPEGYLHIELCIRRVEEPPVSHPEIMV